TVVQYSTLAVAIQPAHVVHAGLGNGGDRSAERGRYVDAAIIGSGSESGILLIAERAQDLPRDGPGESSLVLREVAEQRQDAARPAPLPRQAPLLQLSDQGLNPPARPLQLGRGLLVGFSLTADLGQ